MFPQFYQTWIPYISRIHLIVNWVLIQKKKSFYIINSVKLYNKKKE